LDGFFYQIYRFRKGLELESRLKLSSAGVTSWKYFFRWLKDQRSGGTPLNDSYPWMNYYVIDFLLDHLDSSSKIFEYGGGGSTCFFTKRILAAEVVTVEHDQDWFRKLEEKMEGLAQSKWKGIHAGPEEGSAGKDVSDPFVYSSDDPAFRNMNFKKYASCIDSFPDDYFDLVLVDGRARPSCLVHALPKVKLNGYLLLDNAEREYYLKKTEPLIRKKFTKVLSKTGPCPYAHEFTTSMIWRRDT